jgi:pilus assembly protein TadC
MGYKNLKRQVNLAKYTFLIYTILSLALLIYSILAGEQIFSETIKTHFGIGYFLFLAGLPLTFLALKAIKKDKSLIDSVDRIR